MANLIKREDVYAEIEDWLKLMRYYHSDEEESSYAMPIEELRARIERIEPVEQDRPTGHWKIKDRYYHDTITAECSECGREVEIPTCMSELMYKGCPYCLAEMESSDANT